MVSSTIKFFVVVEIAFNYECIYSLLLTRHTYVFVLGKLPFLYISYYFVFQARSRFKWINCMSGS